MSTKEFLGELEELYSQHDKGEINDEQYTALVLENMQEYYGQFT